MKRYLIHLFLICFFFFLPLSVFADEIEIVSITPVVNDDVVVKDEEGYNFSVELYEPNQELNFRVTLKNTTNVRMLIREISVSSPTNPNLEFSYAGIRTGSVLDPGTTKEFTLTVTAGEEELERSYDDNFVFNINYERNEITPDPSTSPTSSGSGSPGSSSNPSGSGGSGSGSVIHDITNPQTGAFKFMVLLIIIFVVFASLKIGKKKFHVILFGILLLCAIQNVYAVSVSFSLRGHIVYKMTYDVSVELNGGNVGGVTDDLSLKMADGKMLDLTQFKKKYYHIDHLLINDEEVPYSDKIEITENMNIALVWVRDYYTVTVDPNGGTYLGVGSAKEYTIAAGDYFIVQDPENLIQEFNSWEINPSSKSIYEGKILVDCDISLKALWKQAYYTLTIDPNGGSYNGVSEEVTVSYVKDEIAPLSIPLKEGYAFSHWEKDDTRYTNSTIKMDNNYTLKAVYIELIYSFTIKPNGGIYMGSSEDYTVRVKTGTSITVEDVTREGYFFNNWIDAKGNYIVGNEFVVDADIVLTAQWSLCACRIGSKIYTSLRGAYAEATDGDIITLLSDITGDFSNDKTLTLDLNGYQLNGLVTNDGTLTVLNGIIKNTKGTAVINNGTLTMGVNDTMVSSTLVGIVGSTIALEQNGTFNFFDGYLEGKTALTGGYQTTPYINGVQYYPFMGHNSGRTLQNLKLDSATDAYVMTTSGGIIYYQDIQDSVNYAASTGYTITVLRDFEYSTSVTIPADKLVEIDLAGKAPIFKSTITNNGTLRIFDTNQTGELKSTSSFVNNGMMYLSNIRVTQTSSGTLISNKNHVNLENSILQSQSGIALSLTASGALLSIDDTSIIRSVSGTAVQNTSKNFVVSKGHIIGGSRAIHNKGGSVTVTGGEVKVVTSSIQNIYGIYNESSGSVKIDGGTIFVQNTENNAYGIYNDKSTSTVRFVSGLIQVGDTSKGYGIYNGTSTITGGKIQSSGYGIYGGVSTLGVEDSTISITSPEIVGDLYGVHSTSLTIYDGIIKGKTGARASLTSIRIQSDTGLFYEKVDEYYHLYLVTGSDYFDVGGVRYGSFSTAYESITGTTGTIKLVKSFESDEIFPEIASGKKITFNLNGKTLITSSSLVNKGTLNIQDSSEEHKGLLQSNMNDTATIINEGTLDIQGGTIFGKYQVVQNKESATFKFSGGTLRLTFESAANDRMAVLNRGNILMSGGLIDASCTNDTATSKYVSGIDNYGTIQITGGKIQVVSDKTIGYGIHHNSTTNKLTMSNGEISVVSNSVSYGIASGENQITTGSIQASSNGETSLGYGIYNGKNVVTSGTIIGSSYGIYDGESVIGIEDGDEPVLSPIIVGDLYGIYGGSFNMYDGHIKGKTAAFLAASLDMIQNGTEVTYEDQDDYHTAYLVINENFFFELRGVQYDSFKRTYMLAKNSDVITVIKDYVSLESIATLEKDLTIDLNGHTFSYPDTLTNTANLTIKDSSTEHNGSIFSSTSVASITNTGTLSLQSGMIFGRYEAVLNNGGTFNMTGGKLRVQSNDLVLYGLYNQSGVSNLSGGTIEVNHTEETHNAQMNSYAIYNTNTASNKVTINGTNISVADTNGGNAYGIYNANNSTSAKLTYSSGTISVHGQFYSCGVYYGDNTISGGSIQVASDAGVAVGIYAGNNQYSNASIQVEGNTNANAYGIHKGQNKITSGTITAVSKGSMLAYGIYEGTNTISGGAITGDSVNSSTGYGIGAGTSTITNATITGSGYGLYQGTHTLGTDDRIVGATTPVVVGELFGVFDANIYFYDGIIKGKTGTFRGSSFTIADDTAAQNEIVDNYYIYYLVKLPCYFEVDGIEYTSFSRAYSAITGPEGTIKVIGSVTSAESLPTIARSKLVYIDLNGYTLNYSSTLTNQGTLFIRDTSRNKNGVLNVNGTYTITNNGTLTVESGTLQSTRAVINNQSNGILNMTGGNLKLSYNTYTSYSSIWNYGNINITGGTITSENLSASSTSYYVYGIYNYSTGSIGLSNATINVTATQMRAMGIYNENINGTFNMTSGTINVNGYYETYGVYNGKNTIHGGTITSTSTYPNSSYVGYGIYSGNNTIKGGKINASGYGLYSTTSTLGTNDGTISATSPEILGGYYGVYAGSVKFYDGVLKGKTDGFQVSAITERATDTVYNYRFQDGYQVYSLTAAINFFEVNGTKYKTLNDAYNAINSTSATIKVLGSFYSTDDLPTFISGRTITLDLNGKTISFLKTLTNNGILNIIDSTTNKKGVLASASTSNVLISNSGTVNLKSGNLYSGYRVISNNNGSVLNITGGEIKVEQTTNISLIGVYNSSGTINMSGGAIRVTRTDPIYHSTGYYSYGIYNYYYSYYSNNTKFNMTGGQIIVNDQMGNAYGINNYSTYAINTISSGTITVSAYNTGYGLYSGTNTITGGTITATTTALQDGTNIIGVNDGEISLTSPLITGGTYAVNANSTSFYDGKLRGKTAAYMEGSITNAPNNTTFDHQTVDEYDVCTLGASSYFLEVNGEQYTSFQNAYNAIHGVSGTIKVISSTATASPFPTIENGKEITLDLNGNDVVISSYMTVTGVLTIDDTSEDQDGSLYSPVTDTYLINNNGTLNLRAGTLSAAYRVIYNSSTSSVFNMTGGEVKIESLRASSLYGIYINYGTANISGGEIRVGHPYVSGRSTYYSYGVYLRNAETAVLNITGGSIIINDEHAYAYGIYAGGTSSIINITDGDIQVDGYSYAYGIYSGTSTIQDVSMSVRCVDAASRGYGFYSGNHTIYHGAIEASGYGSYSATMTIGVDDGTISNDNLTLTGGLYGVYSGYTSFYDGIIQGKTAATGDAAIQRLPHNMTQHIEKIGDYYQATIVLLVSNYLEVNDVPYNSFVDAYNSITGDTGVIKVIASITSEAKLPTIASGKHITLDLNGFNITYTQSLVNQGELTIIDNSDDQNGFLINTSKTVPIITNSGVLNIHEASLVGTYRGIENSGTVNMDSGTMIVQSTLSSVFGIYNTAGTINLTGGELRVNHTNTPESSGYYAYGVYNTSNSTSTVVNIDGAKIIMNDSRGGYCYGIYHPGQSSKTNFISGEITVYGYSTVYGIYYGNNTISDGTLYASSSYSTTYATYYGVNTISGGTISAVNTRGYNTYGMYRGSNNISGGEIYSTTTATGYGIYDSTVTMTGGKLSASSYGLYSVTATMGVLDDTMSAISPEISGGLYGAYSGSVTIHDGILKGKTNSYYNTTVTSVLEGLELKTYTSGDYVVTHLGEFENPHYDVDGEGYSSFQQALNALPEGNGTIKVLVGTTDNVIIPVPITSDMNVTLDLNGKTINLNDSLRNEGTLIIKDTTTNKNGNINGVNTSKPTVLNTGTINIKSGKVSSVYVPVQNNAGSVTISGGKVINQSTTANIYGITNYGGSISFTSGSIIVNHTSSYKSTSAHAYAIYNSESTDSIVNINGGMITMDDPNGGYAYAIYNANDSANPQNTITNSNTTITVNGYYDSYIIYRGTNTISGGTITLTSAYASAIGIYYGVSTYSGATMTITGSTRANAIGIYYGSSEVSGGTISVTAKSGYYSYGITNGTHTVSAGTIKGLGGSYGIGIGSGTYTITGGSIQGASYGISGGTYTLGVNDETISTTKPAITGESYGCYNGTIIFYDGVLKGKTNPYYNPSISTPTGTSLATSTSNSYKTCYLQRNT